MSLKRLVYLTSARLPTEKAHGLQIMKMCEAFADNGLDVTLLYPHRRQPPGMASSDGPFSFYGVRPVFEAKRLPCFDVGFLKRISESLWFWTLDFTATASILLESRRFSATGDVTFYSRDPLMTLVGLALCRNIPRRWVFEAHRPPSSSRVAHRLGNADALVVLTEGLRKAFVAGDAPPERVQVAPDGVDLTNFTVDQDRESCRRELGLPVDGAIVGYVGRFQTMGEEKGISELIAAMGDRSLKDAMLVCVGGPMSAVDRYLKVARLHQVSKERLEFFDRVPHREVPRWIRAFDVAAMPFPDAAHYSESMSPLKLFEYMAVEAPILATDLPSVREVLQHDKNAWLVEPGSAKALASGLSHLLHNREDAARLGRQARADATFYTWDRRAKTILTTIEQIPE